MSCKTDKQRLKVPELFITSIRILWYLKNSIEHYKGVNFTTSITLKDTLSEKFTSLLPNCEIIVRNELNRLYNAHSLPDYRTKTRKNFLPQYLVAKC